MKMTDYQIGINHPDFSHIRETMDKCLNTTLQKMISRHFTEGSVTIKIDIGIKDNPEDPSVEVDPETGEIMPVPTFGGKVTINIPQKASASLPAVFGHGLRYDDENERYLMINPQISMDELIPDETAE